MEYKIYKDCTFRADKFEKGKSYKLTSKEYRCLKAMGVLDAPKKTKKDSVKKTDLTN